MATPGRDDTFDDVKRDTIEEEEEPLPKTIQKIEFAKEKFMSSNMNEGLSVEPGVAIGTLSKGHLISVKSGGDYNSLANQMSIAEFNNRFKSVNNLE